MFKKLVGASLSLILALNSCGKANEALLERSDGTKLLFDVYLHFPTKTPINFLDKKLETVVGSTIVYLGKPTVTFESLKKEIPQSKCNVQKAFYYKDGERYEISEKPINIQEGINKVCVVCDDEDDEDNIKIIPHSYHCQNSALNTSKNVFHTQNDAEDFFSSVVVCITVFTILAGGVLLLLFGIHLNVYYLPFMDYIFRASVTLQPLIRDLD
jgi:hypothetical protein